MNLRKWARDCVLVSKMCFNMDEIELLGRCTCGCKFWKVSFRGRIYHFREKDYDMLRRVWALVR